MARKINQTVGLGLIGCGGFGEFCLETYQGLEGLRPVAVADSDPRAAQRLAQRFDLAACATVEELITRPDVDLVHIATPPESHYPLAMEAARASRHVLCEKPLATRLDHAEAMLAMARRHGVIMPVNFVLQYNPVTDAVRALVDSGLLGEPLHASFENFAQDESLHEGHWFWRRAVSGGILIEHGVHFFNLYTHWFGPARLLSAHAETRPGTESEDRVLCVLRHERGLLATHYHGFDQPGRLDRQLHRIEMEIGEIIVHGWVPEAMEVMALVDPASLQGLRDLLPGCTERTLDTYDTPQRQRYRARWRERTATARIHLAWQPGADKQTLYRQGLRNLLREQLEHIRDPSQPRRVSEQDGYDALVLAVRAADLARGAPAPE